LKFSESHFVISVFCPTSHGFYVLEVHVFQQINFIAFI